MRSYLAVSHSARNENILISGFFPSFSVLVHLSNSLGFTIDFFLTISQRNPLPPQAQKSQALLGRKQIY